MRFASLGSGSRGNATLVEWSQGTLLIDCGFSIKEAERRLARLHKSPHDISALLVTHEHTDHIRGVAGFARRYNIPVYMTRGTFEAKNFGELPALHIVSDRNPFSLSQLHITPVAVPHDAKEPVQFIFETSSARLGLLTDLGCITASVEEAYQACDAMILEANHDPVLLARGSYPPSLKRRVGGQWGHLSNTQAAGFLARLDTGKLQHLVIAHISEKNNSRAATDVSFLPYQDNIQQITYACQEEGFTWLSIR